MEIRPPNLTSYQKRILFSKSRFTVTEAGTKVGKTYSHIVWIFGKANENQDSLGKNYWWVAPVYQQTKIAFKRLRRYLAQTKLFEFNESNLIIKCPNGAEIHFRSAEKPDNLYGEDVYAAVFDEAPRAREEAWFALRSTLSSTKAPCKMIGNFGGISNWVHKLKEKVGIDPEYEYFRVTCWDAIEEGILDEAEVLQAKKDLPTKVFKALYEAEASEDEGQLINNDAISAMFANTHIEGGIKYITADIARLGKDRTVIYVWDGFRVERISAMDSNTVTEAAARIRTLASEFGVSMLNTLVDEDGVGGGVKDILKCSGFVNNARPLKVKGREENFASLKDQCEWHLAEHVNAGRIYVSCEHEVQRMLTEELEWIRLPKELDTSKIRLLSKENRKKELGRSPDFSDALMMRMFFDINPNKGKYYVY